jgi:hypothetical protein
MTDTDKLRELANSTIGKSVDQPEIEKAAQLLKLAAEIDQCRAEARKANLDRRKVVQDLRESRHRLKTEDTKAYISLLAPVFTTLVLAGTLVLQSYQFIHSERDKQVEAQRQAAVAEDVRWAEAIKLLQSDKLTPASLLLKSFIRSDRYGPPAYRTAVSILIKTEDPEVFANLFVSIFDPIDWSNAQQVFDINRSLTSHLAPLLAKPWDPKKGRSDLHRLNRTEQIEYDYLKKELKFISIEIALSLKGPRPAGIKPDLHSTSFWGDLRGADLRGANLNQANLIAISVQGADLSEITEYDNVNCFATAWWQASKISGGLLQYLIATYPFDPKIDYHDDKPSSKADYEVAIARFQRAASQP